MNQRETALEILNKTIREESYSNLLMRSRLQRLEPLQRAFVTNLVNGVLRKYESLSYQFEDEIDSKTSLRLKIILCMALFERFNLNEKDYVVNNEYAKLGRNRYEKAFINALLHKIKEQKPIDKASVEANLPEWIYGLLKSQYPEEELERIINVYQNIPKVYYRLNKKRCSYADLEHLGIEIINDEVFTSSRNLLSSKESAEGMFYVQDLNSASLYHNLDLEPDMSLLDVCSAPGSKLFNCLDIIAPRNAYANDIHENRVELIRKMADKLGFEGINYLNHDGRELKDHLDKRFDRIMLDAPCSGLGVISRKPDLKFHIRPENLDELQVLQRQLLDSADSLVKKDGILLYSTCALNKKENSRLISRFLEDNDDYVLLKDETIINGMGDCFYYAKLKKIK